MATALAAESVRAEKPTVVLIGDSIRLGYAPIVKQQLADRAEVVGPAANGGDSSNVLRHLDEWVVQLQPAIVHFNCGIHDTKKSKKDGTFQTSPEQYEKNLRAIVAKLRSETKAVVLFAVTTPIRDAAAAKVRAERDYELLNASTEQYNAIARRVMQELDVPVNDLRAALGDEKEQARLIVDDGVHFTGEGSKKLGTAVAEFVGRYLPKQSDEK
jgi:lysophospholipase L1-like esterase